jgi:surface carbohydrate biosynthesis protein (TIGR04326 family)
MNNIKQSLLIIDFEQDQNNLENSDFIILYCWRHNHSSSQDHEDTHYLPDLIDENFEYLKNKFLEFVYQFPLQKIAGKPLKDHLSSLGINWWWTTLLAEKNIQKFSSRTHYQIFQLLQIRELIEIKKIKKVIYRGEQTPLCQSLKSLCLKLNLEFDSTIIHKVPNRSLKKLVKKFPVVSFYIVFIKEVIKSLYISFYLPKPKKRFADQDTFFIPFRHFNREKAEKGELYSQYLLDIPTLKKGHHYNFLFQYVIWEELSFFQAVKYLKKLIAHNPHSTIELMEQFSNIRLLLKVFFIGPKLIKRHSKYLKKELFLYQEFDFSSILLSEWRQSLIGDVWVANFWMMTRLKSFFETSQSKKKFFYLCEMQGLESIINQLNKKNKTYGIIHATIKKSLLKFYHSPKNFSHDSIHPYPLPEKICVNGVHAKSELIKQGIPEKKLIDIEAHRFNYLLNLNKLQKPQNRLLIICSMLSAEITEMMELLKNAQDALNQFDEIIIKPHPLNKNIPMNFSSEVLKKMKILNAPLEKILPQISICLVANSSSALLEPLYLGLPTIIASPRSFFDLASVDECRNLLRVKNVHELNLALNGHWESTKQVEKNLDQYFYLDKNYTNWGKLL